MAFICEVCNYKTTLKPNYNRHLKTKRHLSKIVLPSDNPPIILRNPSDNIYHCTYCNFEYTRLDNLHRHQKKCVKQILLDKDKILLDKDKQISDKDKEIELLKKTNEHLLDKTVNLNNKLHTVKDNQLSVLQNNLKPSNNNNTQIIIHNYPNAPNVSFPDTIKVDESLKEYIQLGGVRGLGKFISDHWGKNIESNDRSIWMVDRRLPSVDSSRNKFLIRYDNAWVIDIDGKQFQEINLEKIQNIFNEYMEKYKFDTHDYLKTMEFIIDIRTKNMIVKGLKDAGKFLVYDKEKFTDFDKIEDELLEES